MKPYRSSLGNASQQQCHLQKPNPFHIRPCRPCNGRRTASSICASAEGVGETSQTGQYEAASFRRGQASSSTALVVSSSAAPETMQGSAGQAVLEEAKNFLREELGRIFTTGSITKSKYAENFSFQDPIVKYEGINSFIFNINALRTAFKITFKLQHVEVNGPSELRARWSMRTKSRFLPWQPELVFSGNSYYAVDNLSGDLLNQRDVWDAVADNGFPSAEGIAHVVQQLTSLQTVPNLDTPEYSVLKKTKEYEVRQYAPFLVADTSMPRGRGPAAGEGFTELANYIFGGNDRSSKMEMTTPVFSTAGQGEVDSRMEFPMERKFGQDVEALPHPNDDRVQRKEDEGGIVAARSFSGLPLDWQVRDNERRLRAAVLLDGCKPQEGYKLARYNDPFTLPGLRKNEVLIRLSDYQI